jgi:hypothetical protein
VIRLRGDETTCENVPSNVLDRGPVHFIDGPTPLLVTEEPTTGGPPGFGRQGDVTIFERGPTGWQSRSSILHEQLLGASRGSDGELRLVTTLAFRRVSDLALPLAGTPLLPQCVDQTRCGFVPTGDDGGVLAVQDPSGSFVGTLTCDAVSCAYDASPIDGRGELHLLAGGEPVLIGEEAEPESLVATFADGRRERFAEVSIARWAATPRDGGGFAVAMESFDDGDRLYLYLRDADGAIAQLDLGPADFAATPGNIAVIASGQAEAEEIRVYRGRRTEIEELVVRPSTGESTRRVIAICPEFS